MTKLGRSRDELETRVSERTAELEGANRQLADEVRERERTGQALAHSEERYRHLVEQSPVAVLTERENRICFANPAALRLLRAERLEEIMDRSLAVFLPAGGREQREKRMAEPPQLDGKVTLHDEKWACLDGAVRDVQSATVAVT